ncbi:MAG: GTP-binding protein, partial [Clostridia bacterium]|nr:GTP-binding protein [Clostridia bacterium]
HHEHGEECHCHEHHHEHGEECHCHEHHHEHGEECHCHEHHHEHGEECHCGCHDHHADEVFSSFGTESARAYTQEELSGILEALDSGEYGVILRAKGIVPTEGDAWLHFDYVPGEQNIRVGAPDVTGRLCVIGSGISEEKLTALFGVAGR